MSRKPILEGRGEKPDTLKPDIDKGKWDKEFETIITYHPNLKEEIQKYLMKNQYYKDDVKVKIKCRDGHIQIERIK